MSTTFWSIWRRLYGEGKFKKFLSRTIQTIIAVVILTMQITTNYNWLQIVIAFGISVWVIIQYWSRAIGEIIDAGLNHNQDAKSYDRWFRVPLDWIYDKLGKEKYVGFYDFWYSLIRYAIGAIPLLCYSWLVLLLMPFQYFIYLGCHKFFMNHPKLYNSNVLKYITLNEPKNVAEVIHGALFGLIVGIM
ncbi:MAG: hypothetical protein IJ660_05730 [Alphaproteobacteria bacterium]|nr:hypothetical protein [Alphaproteobacteria bacterium]